MAKKRNITQSGGKVKKKKWYTIIAPDLFNKKKIGECPVSDSENLIGKSVKVNLMFLLGEIKKQNINMKFLVQEVKENVGYTIPTYFELSSSIVKKLVRRKKNRLDDSIILQTKDNKKVRIKPFVLTRNRIKGLHETDVRNLIRANLNKIVANTDYMTLFKDVINYSLQKKLKEPINKIVPIKNCDVRVLKLEKDTAKLSTIPKIVPRSETKDDETKQKKVVEKKTEKDINKEKATDNNKEDSNTEKKQKEENKDAKTNN